MTNLYDETVKVLAINGKKLKDIAFVSGNGHSIPLDNFVEVAKACNYDSGYGQAEIPLDLKIVGRHWWLERHEYDGSEWWEYRTPPVSPDSVRRIAGFDSYGEYIYHDDDNRLNPDRLT